MPTVKDVTPYLQEVVLAIRSVPGVNSIHVTGSLMKHAEEPNYPIKDIDIIVGTTFNSGDLLAIDTGPVGPFKLAADELEDFGFDPKAVRFTKAYTALKNFNIDHWATSEDNKLLHWGRIPETIEQWQEIHDDAEQYASESIGYNRLKLAKRNEENRRQWHEAYTYSVDKAIGKRKKGQTGWYASDHPAAEIVAAAKQLS